MSRLEEIKNEWAIELHFDSWEIMRQAKIQITVKQAEQFNLMIDALREIRKQRNSKHREEINRIWNINDTKRLSEYISIIQDITFEALKSVKPIKIKKYNQKQINYAKTHF